MRAARKRTKKTQEQVAVELDVKQPLVSRWEKGDAVPPPGMWRDIAGVYGMAARTFVAAAIEAAEQIEKLRAS